MTETPSAAHESTRADLRQASGLRHRADPGAGGVRRFRLPEAGARPLPEGRFSDHHGDHPAARLGARGNRAADHRQDRRGRQHDYRHRRAAVRLRRRAFRRSSSSLFWRRTATWRRRTCATRSTACCPMLPRDIEQPTVEKLDPDATPMLTIAVSAPPPATLRDITEYCDKVLRRQLETINGVGPGDARRRPGPPDQRACSTR